MNFSEMIIYISLKTGGHFEDIYKWLEQKKNIDYKDLDKTLKEFKDESLDVKTITIPDDTYPDGFKLIWKCPFIIYYYGDEGRINTNPAETVAIITDEGKKYCDIKTDKEIILVEPKDVAQILSEENHALICVKDLSKYRMFCMNNNTIYSEQWRRDKRIYLANDCRMFTGLADIIYIDRWLTPDEIRALKILKEYKNKKIFVNAKLTNLDDEFPGSLIVDNFDVEKLFYGGN